MNSESRYVLMNMPDEKIRVYKNGLSVYSPGGTFEIYCDFDLTLFPFDTQHCALTVESWRYTRQYMQLQFFENVTLKYFQKNEQWELIDVYQTKNDLTYQEPGNSFSHVEFHIVVQRKIMYYM